MKGKHLYLALMAAAIALTATSAHAVKEFTGAVSDNWHDPANWNPPGVPTSSADRVRIGTSTYSDVSARVSASSVAESNGLEVAGYAPGALTIGAGGTLSVAGSLNIGHSTYMSEGYSFAVTQEADSVVTVEYGGSGFYISGGVGAGATSGPHVYRLEDGAAINMSGTSGYTGQSFWMMGGTMEIAGAVTLNAAGGPADFGTAGGPPPAMETYPVLKFVGNQGEAKLTTTGAGQGPAGNRTGFLSDGGDATTYVDVSELIPTSNDWVAIVETEEMLTGSMIDFVTGTDPIWEIRLTDGANGKIEVRWNGIPCIDPQLGDMDGSDGMMEPNGNDINPFVMALVDRPAYEAAYPGLDADLRGDCAQDDGLLNGNDITPFVVLLTGGSQAVPEPLTLMLLAAGGGLLVRRRRVLEKGA